MRMDITVPRNEIAKLKKELAAAPNGFRRALSGAINKTAGGVKTDTVRAITKAYTVKGKDVRTVLRLSRKATPQALSAAITGQYKPLPLLAFKVRPAKVTRKRPKGGLAATIRRGQVMHVRTGFIAAFGGQARAMIRKSKSRFPVRALYGPTVAKLMTEAEISGEVMAQASERLAVNMDRQAKRILKT